ncbi:FAD:protein FMN transferase [Amedibacillus sp. YH-ame6]
MKKIWMLLCIGLLLPISGCSTALKKYSMTATDLGFDTVVSFIAYTENEATFNTYKDIVQQEFKRYDHLFDKYNDYENINNIKTINDQAGISPVKVDKEIIDFLALNKTYASLTNQQFDITMGSVLNIWHDAREEGLLANKNNTPSTIPDINVLQDAKKHTGWDHIKVDTKNSTVYIDDKDVSLDVGGSAKGYAVEKIAQELEKKGCKNAILNGGGNIRLIGNKPESDGWSVGVQIPNLKEYSSDSLVSVLIDESMSFVTSGDYQRYYMYGDQIMHHIIDPSTLMPARHCRSVTVITEDSGIADILSTTLYTLSHKDGLQLIKNLKEKEGIEVNAIWVYDEKQPKEDGTTSIENNGYEIVVTDGIKNQIKK